MFETLRNFSSIRNQIQQIAETMKQYEELPVLSDEERKLLVNKIQFFEHSTKQADLLIGAVKGGGDFPSVIYGNSYVYVTIAQTILFKTDKLSGLAEVKSSIEPQIKFSLLQENVANNNFLLDQVFGNLCGIPVEEVIETSDYKNLKAKDKSKNADTNFYYQNLIRPPESDSGNLSIQLKSTAEYGTAIKFINEIEKCDYLLLDGTLSLPFIGKPDASLFYEHLKRLCCIEAHKKQIGLVFLSANHGIVETKLLENLIREKLSITDNSPIEHSYFRFPIPGVDEWTSSITQKYKIPPIGAVTYLVWLHKNLPPFRLDLDRNYWLEYVYGETEEETFRNEHKFFEVLDYLSHEQRSFGYPYPLKAVQNRVRMSRAERSTLRKQVIDECVRNGMKRALFREPTNG